MSNVPLSDGGHQLRGDLHSIPVGGRRRAYRIVHDEISGRFSRVSEHLWQSLCAGSSDARLWSEAQAAGWTRHRSELRRRFSPLSVRIPLCNIDPLVSPLVSFSGLFFSPLAVALWAGMIVVAAAFAANHSAELLESLGSLASFLGQSHPLWLAFVLAATKVAHELAHGVMCRRMGARCGKVGLLVLCGVPCPYCDVTAIWREPSASRRAAVMLAGIYMELIIAALATFVWLLATEPNVRFHALNLMVVCGISTIVFNANPLMRYDGYYVLSDLLGTTNLRQQAGDAFKQVVTARIAGPRYSAATRSDARSLLLAVYHVAATLYRLVIVIAIASLLLALAQMVHLRSLATGFLIAAAIVAVARQIGGLVMVARGGGRWRHVPWIRRTCFTMGPGLLVLALLLCPLPRYRAARGWVDATDAASVFLPGGGMITAVMVDVGDQIQAGQLMLKLKREGLAVKQAQLRGQLRIAKLRSRQSRRVALDHASTGGQWKTLQATEDAFSAQLAAVSSRLDRCEVESPIDGVVLPAKPRYQLRERARGSALRDRAGSVGEAGELWCRISTDGKLEAVLVIDARDRTCIDVGTPVRISLGGGPDEVFNSSVAAVSMIVGDKSSGTEQAAYQTLCPLPNVPPDRMLRWLGRECKGVFHLPSRTLASDATEWVREWLGGG